MSVEIFYNQLTDHEKDKLCKDMEDMVKFVKYLEYLSYLYPSHNLPPPTQNNFYQSVNNLCKAPVYATQYWRKPQN
jgi:hypothetical protein